MVNLTNKTNLEVVFSAIYSEGDIEDYTIFVNYPNSFWARVMIAWHVLRGGK